MFVTLIDTHLVTSWRLVVRPIIKTDNFWEEKRKKIGQSGHWWKYISYVTFPWSYSLP